MPVRGWGRDADDGSLGIGGDAVARPGIENSGRRVASATALSLGEAVTAPNVLWPSLLGLIFVVAGVITWRRDLAAALAANRALGWSALGPALIASALAAFAGEHFTMAASLVGLVPKWLPGPLFITYFVGVAHLAAALSLVARRAIAWSGLLLAVMFALFVLTLYLPSAIRHPAIRVVWIFPFREGSFAVGGLALFAVAVRGRWPIAARGIAVAARYWTAAVLAYFGVLNLMYPQCWPGVPSEVRTASWVPLPTVWAYLTGLILIGCGIAMLTRKLASAGATCAGLVMVILTLALYVPQYLMADTVPAYVTAYNFVFDTLLFAGTMFAIGRAIERCSRGDVRHAARME